MTTGKHRKREEEVVTKRLYCFHIRVENTVNFLLASIPFVIVSENILLLSMSCSDFSVHMYISMYISSAGDVLKLTFVMSD